MTKRGGSFGASLALAMTLVGGLLVGVLSWPGTALAGGVSLDQAKQLVQGVSKGQADVSKVFPGPGGLTGVVIQSAGHGIIGWITPDGKNLLLGPLLNATGQDQTRLAMEAQGLVPKPMAAASLAAKTAQAKTFVVGKRGPELTVFVDPNCIFCHKFYEQAKPLVNEGRLRVRYVVVGFLKPNSAGKAAAILGAKNPVTAMARNEKGFDVQAEEGGIKALANPPAAVKEAVTQNTQLLAQSGEVATPTLLFCDKAGTIQILHGMPREGLAAWVKGIGNLQGAVCKG